MSAIEVGYQAVYPSPCLPAVFENYLASGVAAMIIGQYASGTVPSDIIPKINGFTSRKIPVFGIRQERTDSICTEWSNFTEEVLPGVYTSEYSSICSGLISLQKDLASFEEVYAGIEGICARCDDYMSIIREATKEFSSRAFNKRLDQIRIESSLEAIHLY